MVRVGELDQVLAQVMGGAVKLLAQGVIDPLQTRDVLALALSAALNAPIEPSRFGVFETEQKQQVFDLVQTGGALSLDMGFEQPINLAIHRNKTRTGITTIMSIGVRKPRTKCFTVYGSDVEIYTMVAESITHLAAVATPAAHAA